MFVNEENEKLEYLLMKNWERLFVGIQQLVYKY